MTYIEPTLWAQKQFGQAHLNDPRRTQRLVALAASLAEQPGVPVSKLIISPADMEGAYRNERFYQSFFKKTNALLPIHLQGRRERF